MPKIVDHDQRRREILEATWRVIAEKGVEAATIREIAKEAGYSAGVLAHYFTNKDEILISAHKLAFQRVYDRAESGYAGVTGLAAMRLALYEALPMDRVRMLEAVLDVSFWSQALTSERLNGVRRESIDGARLWWMDMIASARSRGEIDLALADDVIADQVQVLIDGISVQAVMYPDEMTPARQQVLADAFLGALGG